MNRVVHQHSTGPENARQTRCRGCFCQNMALNGSEEALENRTTGEIPLMESSATGAARIGLDFSSDPLLRQVERIEHHIHYYSNTATYSQIAARHCGAPCGLNTIYLLR